MFYSHLFIPAFGDNSETAMYGKLDLNSQFKKIKKIPLIKDFCSDILVPMHT